MNRYTLLNGEIKPHPLGAYIKTTALEDVEVQIEDLAAGYLVKYRVLRKEIQELEDVLQGTTSIIDGLQRKLRIKNRMIKLATV